MFEDCSTACKNFQNIAAELVERFESQPPCTESGPFNYIMLDQSRGQGQIFLHPTRLVHQFQMQFVHPPQPSFYEEASLQKFQHESTVRTSAQAECDPQTSACIETVASAYAVPPRPHPNIHDLDRSPAFAASSLEEVYGFSQSEEESNRARADNLDQAAEDFVAVFGCSDEQLSFTDLLDSEVTCDSALAEENAGPWEQFSRKRVHDVDEEVDSRCNKRQRSQDEMDDEVEILHETCSSSLSVDDTFSGDSLGPSHPQEDDFEEQYEQLDEAALEMQMMCEEFEFEVPEDQQCSSCSKEDGEDTDTVSSGSARKCRRDKIKSTMKLLRNLIPGCASEKAVSDAALVLEHTIRYVNHLQLKVQILENQKPINRARLFS